MHDQLNLEFKAKATGRSQNANVVRNLRNSSVQGFKIYLWGDRSLENLMPTLTFFSEKKMQLSVT